MVKKPLTWAIIIVLLVVLTFANLLFAFVTCAEAGPSYRCDITTERRCRQQCRREGGDCQDWYWQLNFCHHGLCYERWYYECSNGPSFQRDCLNTVGTCGV